MNCKAQPQRRDCRGRASGSITARESGSSSLARMRLIVFLCAPLILSLHVLLMAQPACAATWPLATSGLSATLSFHQSYTAGIKSYVHSGIDIPASAGMQISSPLAGTVRFAGTVPSGDSRTGGPSSQTMNAVSIEVADGKTVTLMPFDATWVHEGQVVAEGEGLGTLASRGDVSTSGVHLHMGYKQGSAYLDPMLLFGVSGIASGSASGAASTHVPGASNASDGLPASSVVSASDGLSVSGDIPAPGLASAPDLAPTLGLASASGVGDAFQASRGQSNAPSFGVIETGDYELVDPAANAPSLLAPVIGAVGGVIAACSAQFFSLAEALVACSCALHVPLPVLYVLAALLALVILAVPGAHVMRKLKGSLQRMRPHSQADAANGMSHAKSVLVPVRGR